jgi:hypothetical protein
MVTARRVDGADISHYQSKVDLRAAKKAGLKFLYHKVSEGDSYFDDSYGPRLREARDLGLPVGGYHFGRANKGDAEAEARRFLKMLKAKPGDIIPALDLETTEGLTAKELKVWSAKFSQVVYDSLGVLPVLYGPFGSLGMDKQILWVPRYNNTNTPPDSRWDIWQFSNGHYGVPNDFSGLGHCDLNTFGKGMTMSRLIIPRQVSSLDVLIWHISMQFSDTDKQQQADANKIFATARKKGVRWITGTEAGPGSNLATYLRDAAEANNYRIFRGLGQDAWIAVAKETIVDNSWQQDAGDVVVDGKGGRYTSKSVPVVSYTDTVFGPNAVGASHYLTKGRPGAKPPYDQNVEENNALADEVGARAKEYGKGKRKFWYGGDQNIVDRTEDTFFGQPLTSCWDELQRWENTGHGNIDVIATYDGDGKVTCKSATVLDDGEFKLHTDHWLVEAVYTIQY